MRQKLPFCLSLNAVVSKVFRNENGSYLDEYRHWLVYERNAEKVFFKVSLTVLFKLCFNDAIKCFEFQIDGKVREIRAKKIPKESGRLNSDNYVAIGGAPQSEHYYMQLNNFVGCISSKTR